MNACAKLIPILLASALLSGCYFANGTDLGPPAYIRVDSSGMRTYILQGVWWHTGNLHFPFDFTVYRYPTQIEIHAAAEPSRQDAATIEIYRCGKLMSQVRGYIQAKDDVLTVKVEYPWPESRRGTESINLSASISTQDPPPWQCKGELIPNGGAVRPNQSLQPTSGSSLRSSPVASELHR